jgi:hypothetical protein
MDHRGPRHLRGVDDAVDQVARCREFVAEHPEWQIECSDDRRRWRAERDGGEPVEAFDLRGLLDELARIVSDL